MAKNILGVDIEGLSKNIGFIGSTNKLLSIMTLGLDTIGEEFVKDSFEDMLEILDAYEIKKWKDFEFYCRYGYFEDDYIVEEVCFDEEHF